MKQIVLSSMLIAAGSLMPVSAFEHRAKNAALTTQQAYLKASDTKKVGRFGYSVAVSGNTAVVGGIGDSDNNGAVYVFVRNGSGWTQQQKLRASNTDGGDIFGCSVAIAGETIVVGAVGESSGSDGVNGDQFENRANNAGAAYVFTRTGVTWSQQAYLKASNSEASDNFGESVAIAGETIVVGADGEDSGNDGVNRNQNDNGASLAGAAYVFTRTGVTWSQQAYLKASNSDGGDLFGYSVAIAGETIIVGAYAENSGSNEVNGNQADNSVNDAGAAYVFTRNGNTWSQQAYLKSSNSEVDDLFGWSVAIAGETIVIGAKFEDSGNDGVNGNQNDNSAPDAGAAYVFTRSGAAWSQQAYFKASNSDRGDNFGNSVAIADETIVIGANFEFSGSDGVNSNQGDNGVSDAGAAYVFTRTGVTWSQQSYLKASNSDAGDRFGNSVAIAGETIVVGAVFEASGSNGVDGNQADNGTPFSGAVYVYTFTESPPDVMQFAVKVKTNTKLGKVTGAGSYAQGSSITLTAKAKRGKKFLGWYEGKKLLSKKKMYILKNLTKDLNLTAKFK